VLQSLQGLHPEVDRNSMNSKSKSIFCANHVISVQ
jgi:hypothetical protein